MAERTITQELAQYVATNGYGTFRENLFVRRMPDKPDKCLTIIPTGGFEPNHYLPIRNATFQFLIRDERGYSDRAEKKAHDLASFLQSKGHLTFITGGKDIQFITLMQEPALLELDANERPVFVFNIRVNYIDALYSINQ